jgi:AraC-like DNA-binding protein
MNKFRLPEGFLAKLRSVRIDPAFLLHKSGLPPTLCSCGDGMITQEQFCRLWHTLGEVSDDPAIGLRMATLNPPRHPSTIAAQHARTFGDALPHLARSTARYFSEHMRIVKTKNECGIEFTGVLLNEGAPAVFVDTAFALVLETGRRGTQLPLHPQRLELTRKGSHQEIYEAHYGCSVRLKARRNSIVFRTDDLQLPFATYNAELLATLDPQLEHEIASRKTRQTTSFRAKRVLKRLLGGQHTDIDEVAKELGMSSRTLQRRIAEEGSSFRQLLSDARRELARLYLQHPSLGLSQAASLLGYEDSNSFLRAFRVWEGVTPTEWRAMQKAGLQEIPRAPRSPNSEVFHVNHDTKSVFLGA